MSYALHRRYPDSLLGSGTLTAHGSFRLVLLRSRPDTVHEFPLRKTRASTPLIRGGPTKKHPRQDITPAVADCRYRAPLSPRLRGNFLTISGRKNLLNYYNCILPYSQQKKNSVIYTIPSYSSLSPIRISDTPGVLFLLKLKLSMYPTIRSK